MLINDIVPAQLMNPDKADQFVLWLQSVPITYSSRLRLYFRWLDHFQLKYSDEAIQNLKDPVLHV